ncbi:MAG: hypothetical protein DRP30_03120 [Thermotoga sp.]|nr:MAG: hypothetical protein DRP30_03120 [Thermotoga sp.]
MSKIVVDMGSWKTVLSSVSKNTNLMDRTLIAISKKRGKVVEIGEKALSKFRELGEEEIELVKPIRKGNIMDAELMAEYIRKMLKKLELFQLRKRMIFILPAQLGGNLRSVRKISQLLGLSSSFIQNPISICVGSGLRMDEVDARIIMDMGYEKTEVSLLSFQGVRKVIVSDLGWSKVERFVENFIRRDRSVRIDPESLEALKKFLGKSISDEEEVFMKGVDLSGKPVKFVVNLGELGNEIEFFLRDEIFKLRKILKDLPVGMVGSVLRGCVILSGGLSFLRRVRRMVEETFNLRVKRVKDPAIVSVEGGKLILRDKALRRKFLMEI